MARYYLYKIEWSNGKTYIGKHVQTTSRDNYVTSSFYFKKHPELEYTRHEFFETNSPDKLDVMETICIMQDVRDNPQGNVNGNWGALFGSETFNKGRYGELNGMWGHKLSDFMTQEEIDIMNVHREESRKSFWEAKIKGGHVTHQMKLEKIRKAAKIRQEVNRQIREAHRKAQEEERKKPKRWYYNTDTLKETYWWRDPSIDFGGKWILGRLPHDLWPEERKESYKIKHSFNPIERMSEYEREERSNKLSQAQSGKVCYTDGTTNVYLRQGQDVPDGFYRGCTFTKTPLYIATRTGRKKGSKNKWQIKQ